MYLTNSISDFAGLSTSAQSVARAEVKRVYGSDYVGSPSAGLKATKAELKSAQVEVKSNAKVELRTQEAHEAIRPAVVNGKFVSPDEIAVANELKPLYRLIYERTLACVMKECKTLCTTFTIDAYASKERITTKKGQSELSVESWAKGETETSGLIQNAQFRASNTIVVFPGY